MEKSFKTTVELDKLIDTLREADSVEVSQWMSRHGPHFSTQSLAPEALQLTDILFLRQLPKVVLENVLSFDSPFWLRLATRADLCQSAEDAVSTSFSTSLQDGV